VHGDPVTTDLTGQELVGLPLEQGIGEALEGLAHHHERAVGRPCPEVQVRQPTLPPTVAPLGGEHHEVEQLHRLHLAPRATAAPGVVRGVDRLDHHAFVARRERGVEERGGFVG
jgi:hypothetical protein